MILFLFFLKPPVDSRKESKILWMPGLCFMFYFCLPLIFVWMALPEDFPGWGCVLKHMWESTCALRFLERWFLAGDFCSMEGECMSTFFFPTQHNGSSLLTGFCLKSHGKRGFLSMFIHFTFKYDILMTIHRIMSVLVYNFSASNGKFIPELKLLLKMQEGFMHIGIF